MPIHYVATFTQEEATCETYYENKWPPGEQEVKNGCKCSMFLSEEADQRKLRSGVRTLSLRWYPLGTQRSPELIG